LAPFSENLLVLGRLRKEGVKTAILSNMSRDMLKWVAVCNSPDATRRINPTQEWYRWTVTH
ncbi:MAG: hypothetical protein ABI642_04170, partial [Polaromonas sp.]